VDASRIIVVGTQKVGITGLDMALEEMAPSLGGLSDEEVGQALLERLGKKNYIPASARQEYALALTRELRRFLGQPVADAPSAGLEIKILGEGCARCESLTSMVISALEEMKLSADVEHVRDMKQIASYGVMGSPSLVINGKVVMSGSVPSPRQLKDLLTRATR
jgi:small redox-active disulfide protein 2